MPVPVSEQEIRIAPAGLVGDLVIPERASGLVLFAHGSGSSRHSPRNRLVAGVLQRGGFATLLLDLLTPSEERADQETGHFRFDVNFLGDRLLRATEWLQVTAATRELPLGYFGASTGAAAALIAAAEKPSAVKAVVSRGGRPDLAGSALELVKAPTLLIVGSNDQAVLRLNEHAFVRLRCEKRLAIVPGATHLFEEPGTLEDAAGRAQRWFQAHLTPE